MTKEVYMSGLYGCGLVKGVGFNKKLPCYIGKQMVVFVNTIPYTRSILILPPDGYVYYLVPVSWINIPVNIRSSDFTIYKLTTKSKDRLRLGDLTVSLQVTDQTVSGFMTTLGGEMVYACEDRPLWVDEWDLVELFT